MRPAQLCAHCGLFGFLFRPMPFLLLCVAIKVENFDDKDKLLKTFTAPRAEIRQIGGRSIPHLVNAVDEVNGTHTDLQIDDVKIDVDLPRKHFTTAALEHGR